MEPPPLSHSRTGLKALWEAGQHMASQTDRHVTLIILKYDECWGQNLFGGGGLLVVGCHPPSQMSTLTSELSTRTSKLSTVTSKCSTPSLSKHHLGEPCSLLFCRRRRHPATQP